MKNFFKKLLPSVSLIKSHPKLQFFGNLLHDPNLWHLNRRSLAGGTAVGLFTAFVPLPMQMLWAALLAIFFRVNLPLSVCLIWITNPITIPPMFYIAYKLGTVLLGIPTKQLNFTLSLEWLLGTLEHSWQPLLLGCFLMASFSALAGYWIVNLLWRLQVNRLWQERRKKRLKNLLVLSKRKFSQLKKLSSSISADKSL